MPIRWQDSPWVRRWRCIICTGTYRYDLSAEDGGPNELYAGHCASCTRGLVKMLRALSMLDGDVKGTCPPQLNWMHSGEGITNMPPNEDSFAFADRNGASCGMYAEEKKPLPVKRKPKKSKPLASTRKKADLDDFLADF